MLRRTRTSARPSRSRSSSRRTLDALTDFPRPILKDALRIYVPEIRIEALWDIEPRLTRDHEDWEVILVLGHAEEDFNW